MLLVLTLLLDVGILALSDYLEHNFSSISLSPFSSSWSSSFLLLLYSSSPFRLRPLLEIDEVVSFFLSDFYYLHSSYYGFTYLVYGAYRASGFIADLLISLYIMALAYAFYGKAAELVVA